MPRRTLSARKARKALTTLRLDSARRQALDMRGAYRVRAAALALRRASPDWVELDAQLKQLQLEAELDAMEAAIDTRRPKAPILNFDLMPGFKPNGFSPQSRPEPEAHEPEIHEPEIHEDVKIQAELLKVQEPRPVNENAPPPPGGKNWKYTDTTEGRRPEHDWRNYE